MTLRFWPVLREFAAELSVSANSVRGLTVRTRLAASSPSQPRFGFWGWIDGRQAGTSWSFSGLILSLVVNCKFRKIFIPTHPSDP